MEDRLRHRFLIQWGSFITSTNNLWRQSNPNVNNDRSKPVRFSRHAFLTCTRRSRAFFRSPASHNRTFKPEARPGQHYVSPGCGRFDWCSSCCRSSSKRFSGARGACCVSVNLRSTHRLPVLMDSYPPSTGKWSPPPPAATAIQRRRGGGVMASAPIAVRVCASFNEPP